ncbi:methyltransferase [Streptomyces rimosus]|uniref:methyltransferase n=1 Tax=Streptomyces rimosus TaxID=1927 RepID=UPI0004C27745|nr:methyltransferase [Streptomyces rimosus]
MEAITEAVAIGRLSNAYAQSKLLHSAVELGVFTLLADGPASEAQIREGLGMHPRLSGHFLDSLVALELLSKADDGYYANTPAARRLLVPGGADYMGALCRVAAQRHYPMWGKLTEALRDGEPKATRRPGPEPFKDLYEDPERARTFLAHMDSAHTMVGPQLVELLDWRQYTSFIDVGGARGTLAAQIIREHPHLTGGVFELPSVEPIFDEHMEHLGTKESVHFHGGDFFVDPLPETDVLILGHILHDWPADKAQLLMERAFPAVRPSGALVVYDQMLDPREPDLHRLLGSLNVALTTGGTEYSQGQYRAWAEQAGFRVSDFHNITTIGNDVVMIAVKDR